MSKLKRRRREREGDQYGEDWGGILKKVVLSTGESVLGVKNKRITTEEPILVIKRKCQFV